MKGTLYIGEEEQQWEVTTGQTLLLMPDRYHYSVKPCDTETTFFWNHFDFKGAWHCTGQTSSPVYPVRHAWSNPYTLKMRQYAAPPEFALAERHLSQLLTYSNQYRAEAYWNEQQLFMELLRLIEEGYGGNQGSPALRLAEKTEAYLRQHYQSEVTNEVLAGALHFHPNYIVRCMKEIYQCTPM
jgi:hypothetical protein